MNRSCAGQLADDGGAVGIATTIALRRLQGVTVVSIDTNRKVAAELFARLVWIAQSANSATDR